MEVLLEETAQTIRCAFGVTCRQFFLKPINLMSKKSSDSLVRDVQPIFIGLCEGLLVRSCLVHIVRYET